jgi:hypothetical protein
MVDLNEERGRALSLHKPCDYFLVSSPRIQKSLRIYLVIKSALDYSITLEYNEVAFLLDLEEFLEYLLLVCLNKLQ